LYGLNQTNSGVNVKFVREQKSYLNAFKTGLKYDVNINICRVLPFIDGTRQW